MTCPARQQNADYGSDDVGAFRDSAMKILLVLHKSEGDSRSAGAEFPKTWTPIHPSHWQLPHAAEVQVRGAEDLRLVRNFSVENKRAGTEGLRPALRLGTSFDGTLAMTVFSFKYGIRRCFQFGG